MNRVPIFRAEFPSRCNSRRAGYEVYHGVDGLYHVETFTTLAPAGFTVRRWLTADGAISHVCRLLKAQTLPANLP